MDEFNPSNLELEGGQSVGEVLDHPLVRHSTANAELRGYKEGWDAGRIHMRNIVLVGGFLGTAVGVVVGAFFYL